MRGWYRFVPEKSSVEVRARAPGHTFTAKGTGLAGRVLIGAGILSEVEVEFPLARLDAKDAIRNHELARFLSFESSPIARGRMTGTPFAEPGVDRVDGVGRLTLTLSGHSASTTVRFQGALPSIAAVFETTFSALGYSPPKLLFLKVQDRLEIHVSMFVERETNPGT